MQRIINLSHDDFDGYASAIAIKAAHPEDHVKTQLVSTAGIYHALKSALKSVISWDRIILSDISIKIPTGGTVYKDEKEREIVAELEVLIKDYVDNGGEFVVLDHHETALPMKIFYNAELHPDSILQVNGDNGEPISGSEISALYMIQKVNEIEEVISFAEVLSIQSEEDPDEIDFRIVEYDLNTLVLFISQFCTIAGDLDVWRDPFGFGGKLALGLDLMNDSYGAIENLSSLITLAMFCDGDFEQALAGIPELDYYYNMASNKLAGALALAERSCVQHSSHFHQIEAKFFSSHCAEKVYSKTHGVVLMTYPNNPNRISFRRHKDMDINLGKFVKRFGGGGHPAAAGMFIPENLTLDDIVSEMLIELQKAS